MASLPKQFQSSNYQDTEKLYLKMFSISKDCQHYLSTHMFLLLSEAMCQDSIFYLSPFSPELLLPWI